MFDEDEKILREVRNYTARKRRTFSSAINSKNLTEDELDELFLA